MKPSLPIQILLGLLLAVLTIFVGLLARNAYATHDHIGVAPRDRDTITVAGEGKISAPPDIAIISLGVQTDSPTVRAGQADNTKKMNDITNMLKQQGVDPKDVTTQNYAIYPRYDYTNGKQNIVGYTVSQDVSVKVRDLDKIGDLLARAGDLGANQVGGVNLTIDDPTSVQAQARGKAIDDAKQKAEALAQQLGLTLVKVVSFSESSAGAPVPLPMLARDAVASGIGGAAPDIQTGSQDVISDVNVVFEVR